uniref:Uncharacterized protein n=1 Tax=Arundo donax TaxID=35708 RepID=A0A0A9HJE9_ARUDO
MAAASPARFPHRIARPLVLISTATAASNRMASSVGGGGSGHGRGGGGAGRRGLPPSYPERPGAVRSARLQPVLRVLAFESTRSTTCAPPPPPLFSLLHGIVPVNTKIGVAMMHNPARSVGQ